MSAQSHRDEEQSGLEAVESPGRRLRIARQAKGMTQADIASQLHLSSAIIDALETDEHERLPGPVFVRGYMRNYARLLGLDENEVIAEYGGNTQAHTPSATPSLSNGVKKEIRSSHIGVRLITWLIVLGLIALLVAWWQGRIEWPAGMRMMPADDTSSPVPTDALGDDGILKLPQQSGLPPLDPIEIEPETGPAEQPAPQPPAMQILDEAVPPDSEASTPSDTGETRAAAPEPSLPIEPEPEPAPQSEPADIEESTPTLPLDTGTEVAVAVATQGEIVFEFIGACWVDVRDATRKFKLFGEMRKGERKVLGGTPPYSVILGNSPMVRVTIDGEPFDVEAHSRGNVARFTLDPGTAN